MRATLLQLGDQLRQSYWFLPAIMAFAAVLLAGGMIWLDTYVGSEWMDDFAWLTASRPSGARQVLSSIGGSMITVAGTVFSVTIAAVVYASGQYGPRLLSNFMSDRGNQLTLGTFIATFLYCLVVLRTVRSPEETVGDGFVPNLALLVGVLLAMCSIAVLIFFIHHVPSKIHINNVIDDIGRRLIKDIAERFPETIGNGPAEGAEPAEMPGVPATFRQGATADDGEQRQLIRSNHTGYVQLIEDDAIIDLAKRHNLVLRLQYRPGDFAHTGRVLAEAWPMGSCDDEAVAAIRATFAFGARRTALQDLRFLIDELVEIAARALSSGVNDPFTAVTCLDWLSAGMSGLAQRRLPSHLRLDDEGALRLIAHPQTFENFIDRSFGALVQYCATDMVASLRYIRALGEISLDCDDPDRIETLRTALERLDTLAAEGMTGFNLSRVRERSSALRRALVEPDYKRRLRDGNIWLGGTA